MNEQSAAPVAQTARGIPLARRTCILRPDRIDVRPSRAALLPPLIGLLIGGCCFSLLLGALFLWPGRFAFPWLAVFLLISLAALPLSAMGLIYAALGANVVIDRAKQSATWQQGLLGLGVGTTELVPFWKIEAILVEEPGAEQGRATEEFAQWQIVLLKKSGRQLEIGRTSAARELSEPARARAREVGEAIARLTGAPLRVAGEEPPAVAEGDRPTAASAAALRAPRRGKRRRGT